VTRLASSPPSVTIATRHLEHAPVVSLRVLLSGGLCAEDIPGQSLMTGRMLVEGTQRRDWLRIADEAEARGMSLQGFGGQELHGFAIDALAGDWETAVEWASELLLEPSFAPERFAVLRQQAIAELQSLADQPEVCAGWAFLEQLYEPHPFARRLQGDAESLRRLQPEDCAAFHRAALGRQVWVVLTGAIDEQRAARRLASTLRWEVAGEAVAREIPPPGASRERRREVRTNAADQAHLYMGHLSVPRSHPDALALEVLSVILGSGAGLTGRIPNRVREVEGLAYSATASALSGAGFAAGRLVAYVGTSPKTVERAERAVREELEKLVEAGVGDEEVEEAKGFLLGREPFRRETARQWGDLVAETRIYGEPYDDAAWVEARLRAIDRAGIEAVIRRHVRPEDLLVTVGLPGKKARKPAR